MSPEKRNRKRPRKAHPRPRRIPDNQYIIRAEQRRKDRIEEVKAYFKLPADTLIQLLAEEATTAQEKAESGKPFEASMYMGRAALIGSALVMAQLQEMQIPPPVSGSPEPSDQ